MMDAQIFSSMELDAIAEVLNISLGSSATAVSNMLNRRVDITTPTVSVTPAEEFELGSIDPAVGVEITYVSGLYGQNIMLLQRHDVCAVVDILMDRQTADEDFVLDELSMSAICEVMNQMMGASATALSEFLGRMVNISTPTAFEVENVEALRHDYFPQGEVMVVVRFQLSVEGAMQSEFMNVMTCDLARELIAALGLPSMDGASEPAPAPAPTPTPAPAASTGGTLSQEEIERLMSGAAAPAPTPTPAPAASTGGTLSQEEIERLMSGAAAPAPTPTPTPAASTGGTLSQAEIERLMAGAAAPTPAPQPAAVQPAAAQPDAALLAQLTQLIAVQQQQIQMQQQAQPAQIQNKVIQADAPLMPSFANGEPLGEEQAQNLDLIMSVPLEVSVEIGRTRRVVKDILGFTKGSLVVLDTLAGDQVNLFVNGQCIARGDVVVVEDNFGIRITEILQRPDLGALTKPYR